MDPQTFATCLIAVTLLTLTPGVDTMLIIRNSARGGWLDGAVSSLGICSGLFVHATVSALGISIILLQIVVGILVGIGLIFFIIALFRRWQQKSLAHVRDLALELPERDASQPAASAHTQPRA